MGRAAGRPSVALRSGPAVRAKSRLSDGLSEWISERSSVAVPGICASRVRCRDAGAREVRGTTLTGKGPDRRARKCRAVVAVDRCNAVKCQSGTQASSVHVNSNA